MRIATWNINGLRARVEFVLHWLRTRKPDAVALQELKLEDEKFPHEVFEAEGYQALVYGQKSWNGVAVLSRNAGEVLQRGLPGEEAFGSRALVTLVDGLVFASLYCPNGKRLEHDDYGKKLRWFDSLYGFLGREYQSSDAILLGGDFNLCPTPLDSWNEEGMRGKIFHTAEERTRFRHLLDWGLRDLYREQHPESRAFSWWDYRGGAFHKRQGLRIDFLLGSEAVAKRVAHAEIDREFRKKQEGLTASDHAPVWVDLDGAP